jgi:hypothetical protein
MTVAIPTLILDAIYNQSARFTDHAGERKRKVTRLANASNAARLEEQANALESLSLASLDAYNLSQQVETDVTPTAASSSGIYSLVNLRLVLGFQRVHPLNPAKIVTAGYAIPAPVNAIVSTTNPKRPVYTRGIPFATAANPAELLGALIDWLEDALTYEAVDGVVYPGEWTFLDARSGLGSVAGVIDADVRT